MCVENAALHTFTHTHRKRRNNVSMLIQANYLLTQNHKEMPTSGIPQCQQLNELNYFNFIPFSLRIIFQNVYVDVECKHVALI